MALRIGNWHIGGGHNSMDDHDTKTNEQLRESVKMKLNQLHGMMNDVQKYPDRVRDRMSAKYAREYRAYQQAESGKNFDLMADTDGDLARSITGFERETRVAHDSPSAYQKIADDYDRSAQKITTETQESLSKSKEDIAKEYWDRLTEDQRNKVKKYATENSITWNDDNVYSSAVAVQQKLGFTEGSADGKTPDGMVGAKTLGSIPESTHTITDDATNTEATSTDGTGSNDENNNDSSETDGDTDTPNPLESWKDYLAGGVIWHGASKSDTLPELNNQKIEHYFQIQGPNAIGADSWYTVGSNSFREKILYYMPKDGGVGAKWLPATMFSIEYGKITYKAADSSMTQQEIAAQKVLIDDAKTKAGTAKDTTSIRDAYVAIKGIGDSYASERVLLMKQLDDIVLPGLSAEIDEDKKQKIRDFIIENYETLECHSGTNKGKKLKDIKPSGKDFVLDDTKKTITLTLNDGNTEKYGVGPVPPAITKKPLETAEQSLTRKQKIITTMLTDRGVPVNDITATSKVTTGTDGTKTTWNVIDIKDKGTVFIADDESGFIVRGKDGKNIDTNWTAADSIGTSIDKLLAQNVTQKTDEGSAASREAKRREALRDAAQTAIEKAGKEKNKPNLIDAKKALDVVPDVMTAKNQLTKLFDDTLLSGLSGISDETKRDTIRNFIVDNYDTLTVQSEGSDKGKKLSDISPTIKGAEIADDGENITITGVDDTNLQLSTEIMEIPFTTEEEQKKWVSFFPDGKVTQNYEGDQSEERVNGKQVKYYIADSTGRCYAIDDSKVYKYVSSSDTWEPSTEYEIKDDKIQKIETPEQKMEKTKNELNALLTKLGVSTTNDWGKDGKDIYRFLDFPNGIKINLTITPKNPDGVAIFKKENGSGFRGTDASGNWKDVPDDKSIPVNMNIAETILQKIMTPVAPMETKYEDLKTGESGLIINLDGTIFTGMVKDYPFSVAEGSKYTGKIVDGKLQDTNGTLTYDDGTKYVGGFKDDNFTGQGTFTNKHGKSFNGTWENDTFTGKSDGVDYTNASIAELGKIGIKPESKKIGDADYLMLGDKKLCNITKGKIESNISSDELNQVLEYVKSNNWFTVLDVGKNKIDLSEIKQLTGLTVDDGETFEGTIFPKKETGEITVHVGESEYEISLNEEKNPVLRKKEPNGGFVIDRDYSAKEKDGKIVIEKKEMEKKTGVRIPGKPDYMTNPYATAGQNNEVDIKGMDPGKEVKCPYTGKMIIVPPPETAPKSLRTEFTDWDKETIEKVPQDVRDLLSDAGKKWKYTDAGTGNSVEIENITTALEDIAAGDFKSATKISDTKIEIKTTNDALITIEKQ